MARWDNEQFNTMEPPDDILCATCKFKMRPVTVAGYTQERYKYGMCDRYETKPSAILWERGSCPFYQKEE